MRIEQGFTIAIGLFAAILWACTGDIDSLVFDNFTAEQKICALVFCGAIMAWMVQLVIILLTKKYK